MWIASLGRPLRLSFITTIWTEGLVFVSASHGSFSSAPSRNLLNMTPDLQGYKATKVNARSAFLAPKLLGQCSLSNPTFFPTPDWSSAAYRPPSAACLLASPQTLPRSSLLISNLAYSPSFLHCWGLQKSWNFHSSFHEAVRSLLFYAV
jgi:hypothetical protein